MAINITVKLVPFGESVYQTIIPGGKEEEGAVINIQEPAEYRESAETAPRVQEIRYQREPGDYGVPSSTG